MEELHDSHMVKMIAPDQVSLYKKMRPSLCRDGLF